MGNRHYLRKFPKSCHSTLVLIFYWPDLSHSHIFAREVRKCGLDSESLTFGLKSGILLPRNKRKMDIVVGTVIPLQFSTVFEIKLKHLQSPTFPDAYFPLSLILYLVSETIACFLFLKWVKFISISGPLSLLFISLKSACLGSLMCWLLLIIKL